MSLPFGLDLVSLLVGALLWHLFQSYRARQSG